MHSYVNSTQQNQTTYIEYNFIDENCLGVVLFFNSTQLNSVKQYLTRTFLLQEVKIPDTELYTKLWIEKEINGRYTWSLTEKEEFFFVSLLFYK